MEYSINHYISESIKKNWEELAFTDFNGVTLQYRDEARKIAKLHILFEQCGIAKGDKIATCGKNSTQLSVTIIAALTYGAVPVPILHEFKPDNIHHLVNHSESKILFTDKSIWENLDFSSMPDLAGAVQVSDYSLLSSRSEQLVAARKTLNELFGRKYPERFTQDDVKYYEPGYYKLYFRFNRFLKRRDVATSCIVEQCEILHRESSYSGRGRRNNMYVAISSHVWIGN